MLESGDKPPIVPCKGFYFNFEEYTLDDDGGVTQQSALWQWYYTGVYGDDDGQRQAGENHEGTTITK